MDSDFHCISMPHIHPYSSFCLAFYNLMFLPVKSEPEQLAHEPWVSQMPDGCSSNGTCRNWMIIYGNHTWDWWLFSIQCSKGYKPMNPKMIRLIYQHDASSSGTRILFWTAQTDSAFPKDIGRKCGTSTMNHPQYCYGWFTYLLSKSYGEALAMGQCGTVWHGSWMKRSAFAKVLRGLMVGIHRISMDNMIEYLWASIYVICHDNLWEMFPSDSVWIKYP